jgi:uncharacterized protein YdeI (YjbR/CyaY-like superfamily)
VTDPRFFATAAQFRQWLERNAPTSVELVVGFHKVGSGRPSMSWSESVDEALCFGWIDGVRKRIDVYSYQIRFTPRKPTSIWSAINIAKFHQLQAEARIQPAGAKAFAHRTEAKSVIYAYEQEETSSLSPEEVREFKKHKTARRFLEGTPPSYRKVVLHWVVRAKKPETRAARLAKLLEACSAGKRLR